MNPREMQREQGYERDKSRGREDGGVGVGDSLELPLGGAVEVSRESADGEVNNKKCDWHS